MKKNLFTFLSIITMIIGSIHYGYSQCRPKVIAKNCKSNMEQFVYDAFVTNEIVFDSKDKKIELEFTAFAGEKYKLVFCTSGFTDSLKLNIYDKSSKVKKRNKVYDNQNGIENLFWSFIPPKTGTFYIEYDVPATLDGATRKGCMVMLIGYEE